MFSSPLSVDLKVERLEVVNKQFVRVYPVPGSTSEVRDEADSEAGRSWVLLGWSPETRAAV